MIETPPAPAPSGPEPPAEPAGRGPATPGPSERLQEPRTAVVTTAEAALAIARGATPDDLRRAKALIRKWASRGHLHPVAGGGRGVPCQYRIGDVYACQRERAAVDRTGAYRQGEP